LDDRSLSHLAQFLRLMSQSLGNSEPPNGKFRICHAIEVKRPLKKLSVVAIMFVAAAGFEFWPSNDARRSGAYSFERRPGPPSAEVGVSIRVAHRSHTSGIH
jgi:hypothetical protein